MFDVGFSELLIIAVVALLVLRPERLPHAARLGRRVGAARARAVGIGARGAGARTGGERLKSDLDAAAQGVQAPIRELEQALREVEAELPREARAGAAGRRPGTP
jgi:sec-independent protein translocase protein TatB